MKLMLFSAWHIESVPTDIQFTGQRLDDTGLYYYGARFYDPAIGRFISPDSVGPDLSNPQSFNRYSYVFNNPLTYNDPSGNWPNWADIKKKVEGVINAGEKALDVAVSKNIELYNKVKELPGQAMGIATQAVQAVKQVVEQTIDYAFDIIGVESVSSISTSLVQDVPLIDVREGSFLDDMIDLQ